jgi:transcriptional regulator with XRE-family HTH domain
MPDRDVSPFGRLLRQWRSLRGMSQLALALEAGTTTRHLSFVETGRSQPTRQMVLRLAEALDVPLRERNVLLGAAGFASLYRESPLETPTLGPVQRMLDFTLERHEPFPAFLVDRCYRVLRANAAGARVFAAFAGTGAPWRETPVNLLRLTLHPDGLRPWIVNWDELASQLLVRFQREVAHAGPDEELAAVLGELLALPDLPEAGRAPDPMRAVEPVLALHMKRDDTEWRLFSLITSIGTPQDVTLQHLRIESFMAAGAGTEERLRELATAG